MLKTNSQGSKRLRVCHIISGDLWAGAEVMAYHLLHGLKAYPDIELSAVVLNEGKPSEEIMRLGIPCYVINESKLSFFEIYWEAKKLLKNWSLDIIHSHRYKENLLAYFLSKTQKGITLVGTQHGMPEAYGASRSLKNRFVSKLNLLVLSRCFQDIVAVSRDIQMAFMNQYGFPKDKVKVIHNGINIPEDLHGRREKDTFVIGSSGRLFPVKDYPLMVEVARQVSKIRSSIRFELAGDGPERLNIQDLIKKYGLNGTFMLRGFLSDISPFYQGLDVYLNTSFHEGIPISVLEAMAYGIPVIAPKVGGLVEIMEDGVQGFLIEGRNPKDFAEKCLQLYQNKTLRTQMSFAVREKVIKEFSIDRMAEQYYSLYRDVAGIG